jgi:hypothetical protein
MGIFPWGRSIRYWGSPVVWYQGPRLLALRSVARYRLWGPSAPGFPGGPLGRRSGVGECGPGRHDRAVIGAVSLGRDGTPADKLYGLCGVVRHPSPRRCRRRPGRSAARHTTERYWRPARGRRFHSQIRVPPHRHASAAGRRIAEARRQSVRRRPEQHPPGAFATRFRWEPVRHLSAFTT